MVRGRGLIVRSINLAAVPEMNKKKEREREEEEEEEEEDEEEEQRREFISGCRLNRCVNGVRSRLNAMEVRGGGKKQTSATGTNQRVRS